MGAHGSTGSKQSVKWAAITAVKQAAIDRPVKLY
jgi:hypothetical protein